MTFPVQRRMCRTCIYRPEFWPVEHLQALLDEIRDPKMSRFFIRFRQCHHSDTACCAGFWAAHKNDFTAGQLAQRLSLVELVDHDTMKRENHDDAL